MAGLSGPAVLRRALEIGAVPASAGVKKSEARWERDGLAHLGWVSKSPTGDLTWSLNVGDAKFGPNLDGYGNFAVMVRPASNLSPWPQRVSEQLDVFLQQRLGAAATVVADRLDLANLLAAPEDVHRGSMFVWLTEGSYPSRLVLAMILARDLGQNDLAAEYRERLEAVPDIPASGGNVIKAVPAARNWAKTYGKRLGVTIEI